MPLLRRKRHLPLRVEDVMSTPPITVDKETPIEQAAKVMDDNRISSVMVVDKDGKLVGIFTDRDLRFAVAEGKVGKGLPIHMLMTENPITISPSDLVIDAMKKMRDADIKHLPVVDGEGKPIGMITMRDIIDVAWLLLEVLAPS
ncbi:MAG: CBS domain-containing protein [Candidatus Korarchaeota archaeon]|nr:CBS domain-containing protein [Candidatus Korarchaeota archaeon]